MSNLTLNSCNWIYKNSWSNEMLQSVENTNGNVLKII